MGQASSNQFGDQVSWSIVYDSRGRFGQYNTRVNDEGSNYIKCIKRGEGQCSTQSTVCEGQSNKCYLQPSYNSNNSTNFFDRSSSTNYEYRPSAVDTDGSNCVAPNSCITLPYCSYMTVDTSSGSNYFSGTIGGTDCSGNVNYGKKYRWTLESVSKDVVSNPSGYTDESNLMNSNMWKPIEMTDPPNCTRHPEVTSNVVTLTNENDDSYKCACDSNSDYDVRYFRNSGYTDNGSNGYSTVNHLRNATCSNNECTQVTYYKVKVKKDESYGCIGSNQILLQSSNMNCYNKTACSNLCLANGNFSDGVYNEGIASTCHEHGTNVTINRYTYAANVSSSLMTATGTCTDLVDTSCSSNLNPPCGYDAPVWTEGTDTICPNPAAARNTLKKTTWSRTVRQVVNSPTGCIFDSSYSNYQTKEQTASSGEYCPQDCKGRWGDWTNCDIRCGMGTPTQTNTFNITQQARGGGSNCLDVAKDRLPDTDKNLMNGKIDKNTVGRTFVIEKDCSPTTECILPQAPSDIIVSDINHNSATISWSNNSNGSVHINDVSYELRYKIASDPDTDTSWTDININEIHEYDLTGLEPNSSYQVQVVKKVENTLVFEGRSFGGETLSNEYASEMYNFDTPDLPECVRKSLPGLSFHYEYKWYKKKANEPDSSYVSIDDMLFGNPYGTLAWRGEQTSYTSYAFRKDADSTSYQHFVLCTEDPDGTTVKMEPVFVNTNNCRINPYHIRTKDLWRCGQRSYSRGQPGFGSARKQRNVDNNWCEYHNEYH